MKKLPPRRGDSWASSVAVEAASQASPRVKDSFSIRRAALQRGLPYFTTLAAVRAAAGAVHALRRGTIGVRSLQEIHERVG